MFVEVLYSTYTDDKNVFPIPRKVVFLPWLSHASMKHIADEIKNLIKTLDIVEPVTIHVTR